MVACSDSFRFLKDLDDITIKVITSLGLLVTDISRILTAFFKRINMEYCNFEQFDETSK